jgi:large subunit ribosomal protein L2
VALKVLKPTNASRRGTILVDHKASITTDKPFKKLTVTLKRAVGRSGGRISVRHRGGKGTIKYRIIDFKRSLRDVEGTIATIEYDPNRNVYISLIQYLNGQVGYILSPQGVKVGDKVMAGEDSPVNLGCALPVRKIAIGTEIHNIELNPGSGGVMVRAAGLSATLMGFDKDKAQIKLPSKEIRLINADCYATIGVLSNADHKNIVLGKAGRNRWKGVRPTVRGMVMPPSEHPHGGGEAKGVIGHVAKDKWGNVKGTKSRRKKNRFTQNILVNRKGQKVKVK